MRVCLSSLFVLRLLWAFFFFSSRRRHTRWPRDWSSDMCSSDLGPGIGPLGGPLGGTGGGPPDGLQPVGARIVGSWEPGWSVCHGVVLLERFGSAPEIGRASCRERVWIAVGGVCE